jgi:peptidylprolyl isomerase
VLSACGGGSSEEPSSSGAKPEKPAVVEAAPPPDVAPPRGEPPKRLIVRDLKLGSGRAIPPRGGVGISTNYIAMSYRTGKPLEVRWEPNGAFNISFAPGLENEGWEKGLVGMKAGGRRELRVPSNMAYKEGAILYVIDLLEIKFE